MDHAPTRFPLAWPLGWPRTPERERQPPPFRKNRANLTVSQAIDRLEAELGRLGATDALLSSDLKLTMSGRPLSGQAEPRDCGVALYFRLHGGDRVLACDGYTSSWGNIAAIAAHIDAVRRIGRYGVGTLDQAFAGYAALPPPSDANRPRWRRVLGFNGHATISEDDVRVVYRSLAKAAIGDEPRLLELNLARDEALKELSAR